MREEPTEREWLEGLLPEQEWEFHHGNEAPMRFAYADPPYLGQGRHYPEHPEAKEWDDPFTHHALIDQLWNEFPDGWAMSASSPSLRYLLPYCPDDIRIAAWVKPMHVFKKGVRPAYAWEPVLFRGGRNQNPPTPEKGGQAITPRDWLACNITLKKGLVGAKPPEFCRWVLDLLGYREGDELVDLFPGTGVMGVVAGSTPLDEQFQDSLFGNNASDHDDLGGSLCRSR